MVRLSAVLLRVPVIKFRKGGLSHAGAAPAAPAAAAPSAAPAGSSAKEKFIQRLVEQKKEEPRALATIKIPCGVLVQPGKRKKLVSLNVTFGRPGKRNKSK